MREFLYRVKLRLLKFIAKFKKTDVVWIYKRGTLSAMVGIVKDRDVNELSYLVQDAYNPEVDMWVKQSDMMKLSQEKPKLFNFK